MINTHTMSRYKQFTRLSRYAAQVGQELAQTGNRPAKGGPPRREEVGIFRVPSRGGVGVPTHPCLAGQVAASTAQHYTQGNPLQHRHAPALHPKPYRLHKPLLCCQVRLLNIAVCQEIEADAGVDPL